MLHHSIAISVIHATIIRYSSRASLNGQAIIARWLRCSSNKMIWGPLRKLLADWLWHLYRLTLQMSISDNLWLAHLTGDSLLHPRLRGKASQSRLLTCVRPLFSSQCHSRTFDQCFDGQMPVGRNRASHSTVLPMPSLASAG